MNFIFYIIDNLPTNQTKMEIHHTISEKIAAVRDLENYLEMDNKMRKQLSLTREKIAERHSVSSRQLKRWFDGECRRWNDSDNDVTRSDIYKEHNYPKNIKQPKRISKYANETDEEKKTRMKEINRKKYLNKFNKIN